MSVVQREALPHVIQANRAKARATWQPFPSLRQFLQDHLPEQWQEIRRCHSTYAIFESLDEPGHYKLRPRSCHILPWCLNCVHQAASRRVRQQLNKFARCSPGGKPRFIHIVQTAPVYDDGTGWGVKASQNVHAFIDLVFDGLQELYGPGIGAVLSYHDFGERGFNKRHPHVDLTLNGWMLQDSVPARTPMFNLRHGGRDQWDEVILKHARRLDILAERGNVWLGHPITGVPDYYRILRYQMRELLDLRKLDYKPSTQEVFWHSYRDHRRERMTVAHFFDQLLDYQRRLGDWSDGQTRTLHHTKGHLSGRLLSRTEERMDGAPLKHGKTCPCNECGNWERVWLEEVEKFQWQEHGDWILSNHPKSSPHNGKPNALTNL